MNLPFPQYNGSGEMDVNLGNNKQIMAIIGFAWAPSQIENGAKTMSTALIVRVKQLHTENWFGELKPQRMDFYPSGRF